MGISTSNKRIAKNTVFLYVRLIFVMLVSLYTVRVILNVLGVIDYGIYNVVAGFVAMFGFLSTSMANGVQRFYNYEMGSKGDEAVADVYKTAFIIQLCLAAVILVLVETFGVWYLNNKMIIPADRLATANWLLQFSTLSLILTILQVPYSAAALAYEKMDFFAIVSMIDVSLKLAITIGLMYYHADRLMLYGFLLLAIQVLNFILYFVYCKYKFPHISFRNAVVKNTMFANMLSFSGWNTLGTFAFMMKNQGVNVLLNTFFGAAINAANGIATQISYALHSFSSSIIIAFKPQLTQAYAANNFQRTRNMMFSMTKISYLLLFTLATPVLIEIDYILHLWLGGTIPEYTVPFSQLTIVIMLVSSFNTPIVQVVHAVGKMKVYQITTSVIICSIIPVSWIALKCGANVMWVYWISIGIVAINQVACLLVLHSLFPYSYMEYMKQAFLPCMLFTFTMPIIPYLISMQMEESIYRLAVVAISTLCMTGVIGYYFILKNNEKEQFKQIIRKRKQ